MASERDIRVVIDSLSGVEDLKFIGGTSLYLQGFKTNIQDVDVLVQDTAEISKLFEITEINEPIYKFQNRKRAYAMSRNVLIDIFISQNTEEVVNVNGYIKCCTISAQIEFFERSLSLDLPPEKRAEIVAMINDLKTM